MEPNRLSDEASPNLVDAAGAPEPDGDRPRSYWAVSTTERAPADRRIGWLVVAIGLAGLLFLVSLFANGMESVEKAPGAVWNDVALGFAAFFAVGAAFLTGLLVVGVGARRLIGVPASRAFRALGIGLIGAPILTAAILVAGSTVLDVNAMLRNLNFIIWVPTLCGIGVTLTGAAIARS